MRQYVITFAAMGSRFNVWLEGEAESAEILQRVPAWVEEYEAILSRFRPQSELSKLNARSGRWVETSEVLFQALQKARYAAQLTNGLCNPLVLPALMAAGYTHSFESGFSPSPPQHAAESPEDTFFAPPPVPAWTAIQVRQKRRLVKLPPQGKLDLGGTAKGWAAEQIANRLAAYGPCLVDAGGDLVARGTPQNQAGWVVRIAEPGPEADQPPLAAVCVTDCAVATSGVDYRRWRQGKRARHHLIDPRTGQPAETDVLSATVIHPEAALAEGYAKALVLMGSEAGLAWILHQPQQAALVVRKDRAVLATEAFRRALVPLETPEAQQHAHS